MPDGKPSRLQQVKPADYIYILFSCIAGIWQAWCFTYGSNDLLVFLVIGMSLPFAVASYIHAALLNTASDIAERPDWKGVIVLWAGMPLSLIVSSVIMFAETGILYAAGFGTIDLPFDSLRILIGEASACLVWAACLLLWFRQQGIRPSRKRLLAHFAALFTGVLTADGLSSLVVRYLHKDVYFLLASLVVTVLSALIVVFTRVTATNVVDSSLASES